MEMGKSVEGVIFGVIFDVGGTLIYSNFQHFERANAWSAALTLRSWGHTLDGEAFTRDLVDLRQRSPKEGEGFRQINTTREALVEVTKRYGISVDEGGVGRLEHAFYAPEVAGSVALPGVVEVVRALRAHVRLAVISNTRSHHLIDSTARKLGVREHFDPFITSAAFGFRKPSPKLFEAVLEAWQLPAEEVAMIGDSLRKDVRPAQNLGMRTLWQKIDARADDEVQPGAVAEKPGNIVDILSRLT